jgi:hypothetical protein
LKNLKFRLHGLLLLLALLSGCAVKPGELPVNSGVMAAGNATVSNSNGSLLARKKAETNEKLQAKSDSLLPLFDHMLSVPVYLVDEPVIDKGNSTERSAAYTICENKDQPTIFVKKVFYEKWNETVITNILKHELTHAWFCRQEVRAEHDERFRKKFAGVGGFGTLKGL